jgi:hypothetical protein
MEIGPMNIPVLKRVRSVIGGFTLGGCLLLSALVLSSCGPSEPRSAGGQAGMRRLTEDQYRNIIADVFGSDVPVGGRFDPLLRSGGLLEVGARSAQITPSGFEQYYNLGRSVAKFVTARADRDMIFGCKPADPAAPDDACAAKFLTRVGRLLYRRPLTPSEEQTSVRAASEMAKATGNFYAGVSEALAGMLTSPKFLFVIDTTESDPDHPGAVRLTSFAKASRLSFLLWDTTPDDELIAAAENGDLNKASGLRRQVDRMLASDRMEAGVRAFFSDYLNLATFDTVEKDSTIYPAFNSKAGADAKESLLRTIVDQVLTQDGDYRDIFTTRKTFITGTLARLYRVPMARPDGGWTPYEFGDDDPRAGILSQVAFTSMNAHEGVSSPTYRGRAIREVFLCQKVPDPPPNVDFSKFNDTKSENRTARQRLTAHRTNAVCAGCHKIMDPIGLALEDFDGAGQYRTTENGAPIDTSGDLSGVTYKDSLGLGRVVHDDPNVSKCLVDRLFSYAVGRVPDREDHEVLDYFQKAFAADHYRVPELLKRIALSDALYRVAPPANSGSAQAKQDNATTSKESKS